MFYVYKISTQVLNHARHKTNSICSFAHCDKSFWFYSEIEFDVSESSTHVKIMACDIFLVCIAIFSVKFAEMCAAGDQLKKSVMYTYTILPVSKPK